MTTMNLWCTTDAGCADTETSRNMSQCQRVRCGKEYDLRAVFIFYGLLHVSTGFKQFMSMANTESYRRSQVCPWTFLLSFCCCCCCSFVLIVSLSASQTVLETEEVHSWGAIVFLLKSLIKHHLLISVSIPNVDIFKSFFPVNTCKLCGRVISGE